MSAGPTMGRALLWIAVTAVWPAACRGDVAPFESEERVSSGNPSAKQLTSNLADERTPGWSSGSDSVYYSAQDPAGFGEQPGVLMAISRDGGAAVPLLDNVQFPGGPVRWLVAPVTAPSGESLAFIEIGPLRQPDLAVCQILQLSGCGLPFADTVPPLEQLHLRVRQFAATGPLDDDPALYVTLVGVQQGPPGGTRTFVVTDYPFQQLFRYERALVFGPSWSPDLQRSVFSDGLQLFIWTVGADGAEPIPGTEDGLAPAWSPDGEWIAFFRVERADSISGFCVRTAFGEVICEMERTIYTLGRRILSLIHPDGSGLTELGEGEDPAWSPDGSTLYFRREDRIWRSAADGSGANSIPFTEGGREPAISPDGRRLAFSKLTPQGDYDLWVIDLASLP